MAPIQKKLGDKAKKAWKSTKEMASRYYEAPSKAKPAGVVETAARALVTPYAPGTSLSKGFGAVKAAYKRYKRKQPADITVRKYEPGGKARRK